MDEKVVIIDPGERVIIREEGAQGVPGEPFADFLQQNWVSEGGFRYKLTLNDDGSIQSTPLPGNGPQYGDFEEQFWVSPNGTRYRFFLNDDGTPEIVPAA